MEGHESARRILARFPAAVAAGEPVGGDAPAPVGDDGASVVDFLVPAFRDGSTNVPSGWLDLVPVAACLLRLHRPRTFVELGTHHGASFFSICEAARCEDLDMLAVAVDTWQGDDQAGRYGDEVFQSFRARLEAEFGDTAAPLRMRFDEARDEVPPGTVDLLHIDGLHTFEAVSGDWADWRGRLSPRGVVMFHDINVFEREFGVWRLWRRLRDEYPSLEFGHGHGLGILAVGEEAAALRGLCGRFRSDAGLRELLQWVFVHAGEYGGRGRRCADLQARLERAERDLKTMRRSVVVNLAWPLRMVESLVRRALGRL